MRQVASSPEPHRIILLSPYKKDPVSTSHPEFGHVLYLRVPTLLEHDLYLFEDSDFVPSDPLSGHCHPGTTCDILLSSVEVFSTSGDILADIRASFLDKWNIIARPLKTSIMNSFYQKYGFDGVTGASGNHGRSTTELIGSPFIQKDGAPSKYQASSPCVNWIACREDIPLSRICILGQSLSSVAVPTAALSEQGKQMMLSPLRVLSEEVTPLASSPFSRNSSSYVTQLRCDDTNETFDAFVKRGAGIAVELDIYPTLCKHFPLSMLQRVLAFDHAKETIVCERYVGKLLSEIRIDMSHPTRVCSFQDELESLQLLASLELARSHFLIQAQLGSFTAHKLPGNSASQAIHRFYHDRLHGNKRFQEFYDLRHPAFMSTTSQTQLGLNEFLSLPIVINGVPHLNLERYFRHAEAILDPMGPYLYESCTALGFGDGHGRNVMVHTEKPLTFKFIDYEISGYHNPILDLGKALYNDAFFPVLYRDLLEDSQRKESRLEWCVTENAITIDYSLHLSLIDCILASIKLEYVLHPLLVKLMQAAPDELERADDLLSAALFSNALLTRNFAMLPPEMFFLSCAVGVDLLKDLRGSFRKWFGWDHWPSGVGRSGPSLTGSLEMDIGLLDEIPDEEKGTYSTIAPSIEIT